MRPNIIAMAVLAVASAACKSTADVDTNEICTGYPDWTTSQYVLPYPPATLYKVIQGNCSPAGNGHRGVERYGYDFDLFIERPFVASRGGVVAAIVQSHADGEVDSTGLDNYITVRHSDGSVALYGHMTRNGARVVVDQQVETGATLGLSGNTGNTNNIPHLHFSVHSCDPVTRGSSACPTIPITFRNTTPNPNGLENGRTYAAQ